MSETPSDRHNRIAPQLVRDLLRGTDSESEACVVLESLILGVMRFYRPKPAQAAEFLDAITERVIGRMQSHDS